METMGHLANASQEARDFLDQQGAEFLLKIAKAQFPDQEEVLEKGHVGNN